MKNVLIGILATISLLSLGFIAYDKFTAEDKVVAKECNKEELCDECICDNLSTEDDYMSSSDGGFSKLEAYDSKYIKSKNVILNGKSFNIKYENDDLYINDKKYDSAPRIYITDRYIFLVGYGQTGFDFGIAIDENNNTIDFDDNKTIGDFQATDISLSESGTIVARGYDFDGMDSSDSKEKTVVFDYKNNKLEINKRDGYNPW